MDPLSAALPSHDYTQKLKSISSRRSISGKPSSFALKSHNGSSPSQPQKLGKILPGANIQKTATILDENGVNVTPRPLLLSSTSNVYAGIFKDGVSASTLSVSTSKQDSKSTTDGVLNSNKVDIMGASKHSRQSTSSTMASDVASEVSTDGEHENSSKIHATFSANNANAKLDISNQVDDNHIVKLHETDTICMFHQPAACVGMEYNEREAVKAKNERYLQVKKEHLEGGKYSESFTQTPVKEYKTDEIQTDPIRQVDKGIQYYISVDVNNENEMNSVNKSDSSSKTLGKLTRNIARNPVSFSGGSSVLLKNASFMSTTASIVSTEQNDVVIPPNVGGVKLEIDEMRLMASLQLMEAKIFERNNLNKIMSFYDYSSLPSDFDPIEKSPQTKTLPTSSTTDSSLSSLSMLWMFRSERSRGRLVNAISWNKKKPDMLAVAYGRINIDQPSGSVAVWSVKSPEIPLITLSTPSDATCVAFSQTKCSILAVGLSNGSLLLYNIASGSSEPIWSSVIKARQHTDAVVTLKWVPTSQSHEYLLSIGVDGRILEWKLHKNMECQEIQTLRQVPKQGKNQGKQGIISKWYSGYSMDIFEASKTFIVGTDEGTIHLCSRDLETDNYLNTLHAHNGPVNKVEFCGKGERLLTCSSDWTVKCWNLDNFDHQEFQTGKTPVNDVSWSKYDENVFGYVTEDGRIEIWDLEYSNLTPLIEHSVLDHSLTQISFSPVSQCVLVGDDNGVVTVYKMKIVKKK